MTALVHIRLYRPLAHGCSTTPNVNLNNNNNNNNDGDDDDEDDKQKDQSNIRNK